MKFLDLTQDFSLHTPAFAGYPGPACVVDLERMGQGGEAALCRAVAMVE